MRRLLACLCLMLPLGLAGGAQAFEVGTGGYPGAAIGAAGNAYIAYKVNTYGPGDGVEFCVVAPGDKRCGSRTRIAFPGQGYNSGPVGVHLLPDGSLIVVTGREIAGDYATWVARSTDGGVHFAPPVAVAQGFTGPSAVAPDGRLGLVDDTVSTFVGMARIDGADIGRKRPALTTLTPFSSITTVPNGTVVASSGTSAANAWLLPTGGDGFTAASWQKLPPLGPGRQPQVSGGRAGLGLVIERGGSGLAFRRLDGAAWGRARSIGGPPDNDGFDLTQDARGRLYAGFADAPVGSSRPQIQAMRSDDRGATWSSIAKLGTVGGVFADRFEIAVGPDGRGVVVSFDDAPGGGTGNLGPVSVQRISPALVPLAQRRVGRARVSLIAGRDRSCVNRRVVPVRLQASVGGKPVSASRYVRRVRFSSSARRLRGGGRLGARYTLRRPARVSARVTPKRGRAFTLRVRMRGCL